MFSASVSVADPMAGDRSRKVVSLARFGDTPLERPKSILDEPDGLEGLCLLASLVFAKVSRAASACSFETDTEYDG